MPLSNNTNRLGAMVWRFVVIIAVGCAEPYTPVSEGTSGWSSDRALEIDATLEGEPRVACGVATVADLQAVEQDWGAQVDQLSEAGTPLFLDRARVRLAIGAITDDAAGCRLPYRVRIESFASHEEIAAEGGDVARYAAAPFRQLDPHALGDQPTYSAFGVDGLISIGAVFGQMNPDTLEEGDEAYWSMRAFEAHWAERGLRCRRRFGQVGTCEGRVGDLSIYVSYLGPELFGVRAPAVEKQMWLRSLIGNNDVVYVNGHAFQAGLDPLYEPTAYPDNQPRLIILDICWASLTMLPQMREALVGHSVDVVATPRRVVTGSVGSFTLLTDAVMAGSQAPSKGARWASLLAAMNDEAQVRAAAREERVDPTLRPPEIYGVARFR